MRIGLVLEVTTSMLPMAELHRRTIQRVKAVARHTKIRDQNPLLGYICPGALHERSSNVPKFEDRSREETEWQEQGAREAAWKLAKNVLKQKKAPKINILLISGKQVLACINVET